MASDHDAVLMTKKEIIFRRCEAAGQHSFRVHGECQMPCLDMADVPRAMEFYFGVPPSGRFIYKTDVFIPGVGVVKDHRV